MFFLYHPFKFSFSCSIVSDSPTPWIAACQASLSIINSQSLLKLISIESVMPSNHLILCRPLLLLPSIFPRVRVFWLQSCLFASGGQTIGASASSSVLTMKFRVAFLSYTDTIWRNYSLLSHTFLWLYLILTACPVSVDSAKSLKKKKKIKILLLPLIPMWWH